jgi:hypothetical protein
MHEDKVIKKCFEFLYERKGLKNLKICDVGRIYTEIERCNKSLFLELKKELVKEGWVA